MEEDLSGISESRRIESDSEMDSEMDETNIDETDIDETDEEMEDASMSGDSSTDRKQKWTFLEHNGPAFAPPYVPLPDHVYLKYDKQKVSLSETTEEMAVAYAKVLDRKFASDMDFKNNFFSDWREYMTPEERARILDMEKCDFTLIYKHFSEQQTSRQEDPDGSIERRSKDKYGYCTIDGKRTKIANYKMEPPGLFRSTKPERGKWKKRIQPEDVTINCIKNCKPKPPQGHQWADIVDNHSVSWLATWLDPINKRPKYMRLSPSSKLKGEEDCKKYDTARELGNHIEPIQKKYRDMWNNENLKTKQIAIAIYLIDTFALRAGGGQDDTDKTFGCCSLRVEHLTLNDEQQAVEFNFKAKASIWYKNKQKIERGAFEGLKSLVFGKKEGDKIFDKLTTDEVNEELKKYMGKFSIKVFRTFRATSMLEDELRQTTYKEGMTLKEKLNVFRSANLKVAKLCNHRRAESTTQLEKKIFEKRQKFKKITEEIQSATDDMTKQKVSKIEENPLLSEHYIDPRVVVAWCLKFYVPISMIYSATLQKKFKWAIEENSKDYIFYHNGNSTDSSKEAGPSNRTTSNYVDAEAGTSQSTGFDRGSNLEQHPECSQELQTPSSAKKRKADEIDNKMSSLLDKYIAKTDGKKTALSQLIECKLDVFPADLRERVELQLCNVLYTSIKEYITESTNN